MGIRSREPELVTLFISMRLGAECRDRKQQWCLMHRHTIHM
jgi:hypothetical protein